MGKNPLRLKRKTHYLGEAHLLRFASKDDSDSIFVYHRRKRAILQVSPRREGLFNVQGIWSHNAENQMATFEGRFFSMLSAGTLDQEVVADYFAMWRARIEYIRGHRYFEQPLQGITPSNLTGFVEVRVRDNSEVVRATKEDVLEYRGVGFYSNNAAASARSQSWAVILYWMNIYRYQLRQRGVLWRNVRCEGEPLLLPDMVVTPIIPVAPDTLLLGCWREEQHVDVIEAPLVRALNAELLSHAHLAIAAPTARTLVTALIRHRRERWAHRLERVIRGGTRSEAG